jgi:hypothetical protein
MTTIGHDGEYLIYLAIIATTTTTNYDGDDKFDNDAMATTAVTIVLIS